MTFDKANTVKLVEIIHNERAPKQILTHMFNTHENNMISIKINSETDRMENFRLRSSTRMWHIAFVLHNSQEFLIKARDKYYFLAVYQLIIEKI